MSYEPKPYPRMLYLGQSHTIVHNEDEEAAKRAEGWGNAAEPAGQEPLSSAAPASCAKCAELEATIERLDREARGYVLTVENLEARLAAAGEPQTGEAPKSPRTRRARA